MTNPTPSVIYFFAKRISKIEEMIAFGIVEAPPYLILVFTVQFILYNR